MAQLQEFQRAEDITPDRFYQDIATLRTTISQQTDPASKAIYQATLAHILARNADRAATYWRETESPADSIQEWTTLEYMQHASALYKEALSDMELLHTAHTSQWIPLVKRGKDEKVYGSDMLYVVWHAMMTDMNGTEVKNEELPTADELENFYNKAGLREAALMVQLEGSDNADAKVKKQKLMAMREQYSDIEAVTEVYLKLANMPVDDGKESKKELLDWLDEAEQKWPNSRWKNNIENCRRQITAPSITVTFPQVAYPLVKRNIPISTKNIKDITLSAYRLPNDYIDRHDKEIQEKHGNELLDLAVKHGKRITQNTLTPRKAGDDTQVYQDTIDWQAPECGLYVLVLEASTNAPLAKKPQPETALVSVSRLAMYHRLMPDGKVRMTVVDGKNGSPTAGADIEVCTDNDDGDGYKALKNMTSDREGNAILEKPDGKSIYIKVSREGDTAMPRTSLSLYPVYKDSNTDKDVKNLAIFTDRAIYRPGQKVMMSAVAYNQNGWDAQVSAGMEYDVVLRDANGTEIAKHSRKTDEMGVLKDTLTLPSSGLPGRYSIRVGRGYKSINVEEYVRPTFQVELTQPETPALQQDTITITGKVTTYSGVPVSHARITGTSKWSASWWCIIREQGAKEPLDTTWTDNEGKFTCNITVKGNEEQLKRGRMLEVNVDALSAQGETQSSSTRISVCSTPLRMNAEVPVYPTKEYLKPWLIYLYSSTDQTINGDIVCTLTRDGQQCKTFTLQAGKPFMPEALKDMQSGCYELNAHANVNGDTASWHRRITLTSISDTVMFDKEHLRIHCPVDEFSEQEPARLQIGSSLDDAWIRVMAETANGIVTDTLLHISNAQQPWAIPYREEYGKGLTLTACVFNNGTLTQSSVRLKKKLPDTNLRMRWTSFRDRLRPGQKEDWTLTVTRPDGAPAKANITATMYDASLDALTKHTLNMTVHRGYRLPYVYMWQDLPMTYNRQDINIYFSQSFKKEYQRLFSAFNDKYIPTHNTILYESVVTTARGGKTRNTRNMRIRGMGAAKQLSMDAMAAPMAKMNDAGLELKEKATNAPEETMADDEIADNGEDDIENLRTNLEETAFYLPDLRTDANGVAHICFTLPESMTSWHMLGAAHTADMMTGGIDTLVIAEKELMAELHLPRFLRNGDKGVLTASIRNCSGKEQKGKATILVCDAESEKVIMRKSAHFSLAAKADTTYRFTYTGDMAHTALAVKWMAEGKDFTDGEQRYMPVLTDMQNITETKAFSLNTTGKHAISLDKLFAHDNSEATNQSLTVEYTRDPKWLAIQTLPSLAFPSSKDAFSLASAYYGGALAYSIGQKFPEVRQAVKEWGEQDTTALQSPLVHNQELSQTLLQETPWVMEASNERARRQRLATLFDDVAQEDYRMNMLMALKKLQQSSGAFSWYPGMKGSEYITREVACQLARLEAITGSEIPMQREMRERACKYLIKEMATHVKELKKQDKPGIGYGTIRTLYAIQLAGYDWQRNSEEKSAVNYMLTLLKKQAADTDREERAMAATVLHLYGENKLALSLMGRLHALVKQPDGTHLAYRSGQFTSIDRKTAEHVQLMEAIRMVEPDDTLTLSAMQEWLIGMKHTQEWDNATQTADAVYALLTDKSEISKGDDQLTLYAASKARVIKSPETVLGYVRERTTPSRTPKTLVVDKQSHGVSYGAVYAQYQIPALQTEAQQEGLNIRRDISKVDNLHEGDRIHVRYTITADRDYEFVRLAAPRPAAAEPDVQTSGYRYGNRLGYYQATHDASTEYFIDQLPRGTYVIEEDWLIGRSGSYALPPALLQCLYAPDYQAHTSGASINVNGK